MKPFVVPSSVLAIAVPSFALAASDADGYPPGLFEHSPLIDLDHPAKHSPRLEKALKLTVLEDLERVAHISQT